MSSIALYYDLFCLVIVRLLTCKLTDRYHIVTVTMFYLKNDYDYDNDG